MIGVHEHGALQEVDGLERCFTSPWASSPSNETSLEWARNRWRYFEMGIIKSGAEGATHNIIDEKLADVHGSDTNETNLIKQAIALV